MTDMDNKLTFGGTKIILPDDPKKMTPDEAIEALKLLKAEEEVVVNVHEVVEAFPLEGAYAFVKAMQEIFGWATPLPGGFFERPPQTISIEVGFRKFATVIWGRFSVPGIEGELSSGVHQQRDGSLCFALQGKVKRKYIDQVHRLANRTRQIVLEQSIYRGQAIILHTDDDGDINWNSPPTFLDLSKVRPEEMVYNTDTMAQIRTNLFAPIRYTEVARSLKVPLKRGILLEGPYGTGKTLCAFVTAMFAVQNGWTFIMVDRVAAVRQALIFARRYQPAVVFAEDIDRQMQGSERTVQIDDVLNTIDGIESKGTEVFVVLTSNHAEKINQAMLRPGRLDAVIHIDLPDAEAVGKLIRIYGGRLIEQNENIDAACVELANQIPATVREVVERSKLYAVDRGGGKMIQTLTGDDLLLSARQMKHHLELLNGPPQEKLSDEQEFGVRFKAMVQEASQTALNNWNETMAAARDAAGNASAAFNKANEATRAVKEHAQEDAMANKAIKDDTATIRRRVS